MTHDTRRKFHHMDILFELYIRILTRKNVEHIKQNQWKFTKG